MSIVTLFLLTLPWFRGEPEVLRVQIHPLDFQDENNPQTFVTGITQIESDGEFLYIAAHREPRLLQLSREGRFLRQLGGKGQGPEELGDYGLRSISVQKDRIWILDGHLRVHYFERGGHQLSWPVKSYSILGSITGADTLTFDRDHVIIPVHPATGHLAGVYDYGGERVRYLGDILPIDTELIGKNRAINGTHWARDENHWYCLFKYWPWLVVFDKQFHQVRAVELSGPEIDFCMGVFFGDIESEYKGGPVQPFFPDFKALGKYLYFFCRKTLYQLDKKSLKTFRRYKLFAKLEDDPYWSGRPLGAEYFTLLEPSENGKGPTLVMGWAHLPWEHDLWTAELLP